MLKRDPVEEHDENCVEQEKVQQVVQGNNMPVYPLFIFRSSLSNLGA